MSKRKVSFDERDVANPELKVLVQKAAENAKTFESKSSERDSRFKKHSLDSDEEDDGAEDNYDIMKDDDIEGQEDATIDCDEGISITPFNMQEELEEGHFDGSGMYIFKKEKEIRDGWMDNIDWIKIKDRSSSQAMNDDDSDTEEEKIDEIKLYRQMIELMKQGESVIKALRRLGGGKSGMASSSASQRWKTKRKKAEEKNEDASKESGDKEGLLKLTGLADKLLQFGDLEIYQDTYEKLAFKVKLADDEALAKKTVIPEGMDDDDALDIFAVGLDAKDGKTEGKTESVKMEEKIENEKMETAESRLQETVEKEEKTKTSAVSLDDAVRWEYKWHDKEDEEIHGPFTSEEMTKWVEDDYFPDGMFVRKYGATSKDFYSSKRIDFELYT